MGTSNKEELLNRIKECDVSKPFAFVSYSKKDSEKVYEVVWELQKNGYNIWMDKELKKSVGIDWQQEAFKAIARPKCKVMLFFVSENSMVSAPVCAELCWSKSDKVKRNNKGEEMKIIPINVSKKWDTKIPFTDWVEEIVEAFEDEELRADDYDVLRGIVDDKYISGKDAFSNRGEIATHIKEAIFDPLGGNKVTFTYYSDIQTIMDNMKITREKDGEEGKEEIKEERVAPVREEVITEASVAKNTEEKIGKYVQNSMSHLIEENLISEDILANMMDAKWTREVLHLSYPLLVKIDPEKDIKKQIADEKGRLRYWAKPYLIDGEKYCICNDWYEGNRKYFECFLNRIKGEDVFN